MLCNKFYTYLVLLQVFILFLCDSSTFLNWKFAFFSTTSGEGGVSVSCEWVGERVPDAILGLFLLCYSATQTLSSSRCFSLFT